jgi:hypothetical protein
MYSKVPNAFSSAAVAMGALFAAHASVAMSSARTADDRDELRSAVGDDREVSMAVGIVMASTGCTEEDARSLLADAASARRTGGDPTADGNWSRPDARTHR